MVLIALVFSISPGLSAMESVKGNNSIIIATSSNSKLVQGDGQLKTLSRELDNFDTIINNTAATISIVKGEKATVEITADSNIIPLIETRTRRDTLQINATNNYATENDIAIKISIPTIYKVTNHGSGDISITDYQLEKLILLITGSGTVTATGSAKKVNLELEGSGELDLSKLEADEATINLVGSGDIKLIANKTITVSGNGAGEIYVMGNPKIRNVSLSGAIDVEFK